MDNLEAAGQKSINTVAYIDASKSDKKKYKKTFKIV